MFCGSGHDFGMRALALDTDSGEGGQVRVQGSGYKSSESRLVYIGVV